MYTLDLAAQSLENALRAVALSQIELALASLASPDGERSPVHDARRRCKKLRGLLRLARPAFPDFGRENAAIGDAAALLSHLRDAEIVRQTIADLAHRQPSPALRRIAARVSAARAPASSPPEPAQFGERLRAIGERAVQWRLVASGSDAFLCFRRVYRSARRRLTEAHRTGDAADFHQWRKAVKNHCYHLDLLRKLAPDHLVDDRKAIGKLAELLGFHHDLVVLGAASIGTPDQFGDAPDIAALHEAIGARKVDLEAEALALGRKLLAERPHDLVARFADYWAASSKRSD